MRELAVLAIALIVLGMTGYLIGLLHRPEKARSAQARSARWHGVAISPSCNACDSARRLWNVRYLSKEAPRLPLADCNRRPCRCRYIHYGDRRTEDRRSPAQAALARFALERRRTHRRALTQRRVL